MWNASERIMQAIPSKVRPHLYTAHGGWYCRVVLGNGRFYQAWGASPGLAWWALADQLMGKSCEST